MDWDLPRTPASAQLLVRLGAELGCPGQKLLAGTGLTTAMLADPRSEIGARQELGVVANLVVATGDRPGLGFTAGSRYHVTTYGLWGFMLISSPTPRVAVETALRYLDLTFAFCRIEAHEHGDELRVTLSAETLPLPVRRFLIEREAAAIRTLQREAFGDDVLTLTALRLALPAPGPVPDEGLFGVTARYDADETVLVFRGTALNQPMPQADEHTAALARAQCRDLLQRRRARAGLAGRVRDLLVEDPADPPGAERIAALLHISPRTLQRRLAEEGTSYRALLNEVREQLATELLVAGGLPVAEVARRLGYLELSSFSQAFRRWTGMGARAYRGAAARSRPRA